MHIHRVHELRLRDWPLVAAHAIRTSVMKFFFLALSRATHWVMMPRLVSAARFTSV